MIVVPFEISDLILTDPPESRIEVSTTSIPTPRPERSETSELVEKPDLKIKFNASSSFILERSASVIIPLSKALSRMIVWD